MIGAGLGGLVLTGAVTGLLYAGWGRQALLPAITFGMLATFIELVATALVRPVVRGEFGRLLRRLGVGMGLRALGIVVFVVAVVLRRDLFPALPTAFGYLGVVVPLLFMETRFLK